jgi:hypothetical protein
MTLEQCPACERPFRAIQDFPRLYVASVTSITPEEVPAELPRWWGDIKLTKEPTTHMFKKQISPEVVEYFEAHPEEEKWVHADGYIYERPYQETKIFKDQVERFPDRYKNTRLTGGDEYTARLNWAPIVRNLLQHSVPLRTYLDGLKRLVGTEVRAKQLSPSNWEQDSLMGMNMGYILPDNNELQVYLTEQSAEGDVEEIAQQEKTLEAQKKAGGLWSADIGIWSQGPNFGSGGDPTIERVIRIGQIEYEGRINNIKA